MEYNSSIAIVGAGPAGSMCAINLLEKSSDITLYDYREPLKTLLCTGGGRCNLAHSEFDFKELAKNYPRGEKFLYSVFSRFSTKDTLVFFENIGIKTYTQEDGRIFPVSNSAQDVREKMLAKLNGCKIKREKVFSIKKCGENFCVNEKDFFDKIVIAVGGHCGFELAKSLGHTIIEPKPSLLALLTKENFKPLQGLSFKNVEGRIFYSNKKFAPIKDDILFTHNGVSGPLAYKVSSILAREDYNENNPIVLKLNLLEKEIDFQSMLNFSSKKDLKNLVSELVPKSFAEFILNKNSIDGSLKCHQVNAKIRDIICKELNEFEITITGHAKDGEVVTSGGVDLKEIDPKTMESKLVKRLYFCGEVCDIDGFCGGFNLQNCWSTGFLTAKNL